MAEGAAAQFHNLEEEIMCSICLEELSEPVSIACGHTFCKACISCYWSGIQRGGSRCPECKKICPRDQLIPVYRLRNLVSKVQLGVKEEKARKEPVGPVPLVFTEPSGRMLLDEDVLRSLFLDGEVAGCPGCLICVIGEKRRGKSFLLNYILRALRAQERRQSFSMGADDEPLTGFDWRAGPDSATKGIWVWNRPFILEQNQEKVAVFVVDTEGSLDIEGDLESSIKLSALSMVLSSYLIFNVNSSLKTTELDYLEMYLHISALTGKSFSLNNLQYLDILVRDWQDDENCGRDAGRAYIDDVNEKLRRGSGYRQVLETLRSPSTSCFLLPHPGRGVVRSGQGRLADMDEDFRSHLTAYVSELVRWIGRHVRTDIRGDKVTCAQLGGVLKEFLSIMQNEHYSFSSPVKMFHAYQNQKNKTDIQNDFQKFKENQVFSNLSLLKVLKVPPSEMKTKAAAEASSLLSEYETLLVGCEGAEKQGLVDEMKSVLGQKEKQLCEEYSKVFTKYAVGLGFAVGGGVLSLAGGAVGAAVAGTVLAAEAVALLGSTTAAVVTGAVGGSVTLGAIGGGVGAKIGKVIGLKKGDLTGETEGQRNQQETSSDTDQLLNDDD
ncbi:RING finger protein 112-like isoform X2 [Spea bombifrons]|nr:RING finger protein 112-like isoform X2 [Spea bombifrons]